MDFILNLDEKVLLFIQEYMRMPILDEIMVFFTTLGDAGLLWIVLALAFLITKKYRKNGAMMTLALVFGLIITNVILKNAVARIRPYEVIEGLVAIVPHPHDWSFPSGHSTSSIAASFVMFRTFPKKVGVPALFVGILICFTRLYVGVHFPTDVICGIIIGLVCAIASMLVVEKIWKKDVPK